MNILFRVDCSATIGMGHLMRCMSLATALKEKGARVIFVLRNATHNQSSDLEKKDFEVYQFSFDKEESKVFWKNDADKTIDIIKKINIHVHWLVVDHYGLDSQWESCLRPYVKKIMVIDDLANRSHECDVLLDQNLYENQDIRYGNLIPKTATQLLGPMFALLRKDFQQYKSKIKNGAGTGTAKKIIIFFGGGECAKETLKSLRACLKLNSKNIEIDVIVGTACSERDKIEKICKSSPNIRYFCQTPHVAELMANADLAIGAGGSTTWERCCLGLPSVVLTIADNQIEVTRTVSSLGAINYLGEAGDVEEQELSYAVATLIENPQVLCSMRIQASKLVDGMGCARVVEKLFNLHDILLRKVVADDISHLFLWRNAPSVRKYSFTSNEITWEEHQKWFHETLRRKDRFLLVGEIENHPIGVLRYDILQQNEVEINIYLVPEYQGQGLGKKLLSIGHEWLRINLPDIKKITAKIMLENKASHNVFLGVNFKECYKTDDFIIYNMVLT